MTLTQGAREFNVLVKGLSRLVKETVNPKLWGRPSGEFVATALAAGSSCLWEWCGYGDPLRR